MCSTFQPTDVSSSKSIPAALALSSGENRTSSVADTVHGQRARGWTLSADVYGTTPATTGRRWPRASICDGHDAEPQLSRCARQAVSRARRR